MIIERCKGCPFFEKHLVHTVAGFFVKRGVGDGTCKQAATGLPFPLGRIQIPDENRIPEVCPLRHGDVLVQIGPGK